MSESNDRFQDVNEFVPNWSPRQSGTKKENNVVQLKPTPESWIIGYYIGSRELTLPGKTDIHTIHKVRVVECGNPAHLGGDGEMAEGGTDYEFFGTGVLNSTLNEKITPGECVRIQWLGLTQPKKAGGREYHNWKVGRDTQTTPIEVLNGVVVNSSMTSEKSMEAEGATAGGAPENAAAANAGNAAPAVAEGDDDLPF